MRRSKNIIMAFLLITAFLFNSITVDAAKPSRLKVPSAPASLTYTNVTATEATLNWQTVSNATGYKLYRSTTYDTNHTLIATISTNTYKNTSLTPNTKYWYYVKAYNSAGTSAASTHVSFTTNQIVPSPTPTVTPVPTSTPAPTATPTPTSTPAPTATPVPSSSPKTVLGYATYYYNGDSSSYNSMVTNTANIDEIATHTYITDPSGNISGLIPTNQITYANSNNIKTLAMVSNNFDGAIAKTLLESATNRQNLINNIITALKVNAYQGVNIDLEGVYYYNRPQLTTFMSELYSTLKPLGYEVTMAVPAKFSDSPTNSWSGAFDLPALAKYTDQMVIMTYDEHYPGGTPGPIASVGWVENVIKYVSSVVPKEKIILGVPAYGYDWSTNGTKAYGIKGAYDLAAANNATVLWDSVSKSPYFNYTDAQGISHSVWFENSESLGYKLDLVNSYNISGIAIWRLGFEDSSYWAMIETKLN